MLRTSFMKLMMIGSLASVGGVSFAADKDPIGRKIDNTQIMDRVALVGVITGGTGSAGVAVIKDTQTGRTYAIKTGDNLPGVGHIQLSDVQREMVIFNVDGKPYQVRLSVGGYAQTADEEGDDEDDINSNSEHEGPGLFEKWHGTGVADLDLNSDDNEENGVNVVKDIDKKNKREDRKNHRAREAGSKEENLKNHTEVVIETNDQRLADEASQLRQDKDGPVNSFLDEFTTGERSAGALQSKIDAANAAKQKIKAQNLSGGERNSAAE